MATPGDLLYIGGLAVMIAVNVIGNFLVCLVILKTKAMRTSTNWLLLHLAIADLLVAFFFLPARIPSYVIQHPSGVTGKFLCKFITGGNFGWTAATLSSFLLVAVAFERYNATLYPLRKWESSFRLVPLLWILAIILNIPGFIAFVYDKEKQMCLQRFPNYQMMRGYYLSWSFFNSLLPICIMGFPYRRIVLCLWFNRDVVPGSFQVSVLQARNKVTKMLVTVTVIFIICWTPPTVLCVLSPVLPGGYATVFPVTTASALLNSSLNPLVYTLHSQNFRKHIASLFSCFKTYKLGTCRWTWKTSSKKYQISRSEAKQPHCQEGQLQSMRPFSKLNESLSQQTR